MTAVEHLKELIDAGEANRDALVYGLLERTDLPATEAMAVVDALLAQRAAVPALRCVTPPSDTRSVTPPPPDLRSGATHPYDRVLGALRAGGHRLARHPDSGGRESIRTTCPSHADGRPSLLVTRAEDAVLIRCFGGCRTSAVVSALALTMADLFRGPRPAHRTRDITAVYPYADPNGSVIAQKVRYGNKTFAWRTPSPSGRGWRWGLHGVTPGLYNLPALVGQPTVFKVEGEKAVDALVSLRLAATCGAIGARRWLAAWSLDLQRLGCRELVILPDHDEAGRAHAEQVAAITFATAPSVAVRVALLPSIAPKGDVVDWLALGHSVEELMALAAEVPVWSPTLAEQVRHAYRRALTRVRVWNHRHPESEPLNRPDIRSVTANLFKASRPDIRSVTGSGPDASTDIRSVTDDVTRNAVTPANVLQVHNKESVADSGSSPERCLSRDEGPADDGGDDE